MSVETTYVDLYEAAKLADRSPSFLRGYASSLRPAWIDGKQMFRRSVVEAWAKKANARRLARQAKKATP